MEFQLLMIKHLLLDLVWDLSRKIASLVFIFNFLLAMSFYSKPRGVPVACLSWLERSIQNLGVLVYYYYGQWSCNFVSACTLLRPNIWC